MILGLAAAVAKLTPEHISTTLYAIKNRDVIEWSRRHLGLSLAAKRHRAFANSKGTEVAQTPDTAPA